MQRTHREDLPKNQVVKDYKQLKNISATAEKYDCSSTLIRAILKDAGIEILSLSEVDRREIKYDSKGDVVKKQKQLPDFKSQEERYEYFRKHQREKFMDFLADVIFGYKKRKEKEEAD